MPFEARFVGDSDKNSVCESVTLGGNRNGNDVATSVSNVSMVMLAAFLRKLLGVLHSDVVSTTRTSVVADDGMR